MGTVYETPEILNNCKKEFCKEQAQDLLIIAILDTMIKKNKEISETIEIAKIALKSNFPSVRKAIIPLWALLVKTPEGRKAAQELVDSVQQQLDSNLLSNWYYWNYEWKSDTPNVLTTQEYLEGIEAIKNML